MQFVISNKVDGPGQEDLEDIELIEIASSIRGSRNSLDQVDHRLEVALPDIRKTSNVSFKDDEDLNIRQANTRRPTLVSILNSRVPRHSIFSTTSINTVDFKQTMDMMKIFAVLILIVVLCAFLFDWFVGHAFSQKTISNSTSISGHSFAVL